MGARGRRRTEGVWGLGFLFTDYFTWVIYLVLCTFTFREGRSKRQSQEGASRGYQAHRREQVDWEGAAVEDSPS